MAENCSQLYLQRIKTKHINVERNSILKLFFGEKRNSSRRKTIHGV